MNSIIILIPAFNPGPELVELSAELLTKNFTIVIVNDGSSEERQFNSLPKSKNLIVLKHKNNLGKGAALKTGIQFIHEQYPNSLGVVTADADGQHLLKDIISVAKALTESPETIILGVRNFDKKNVPLRSFIGNILTRKLLSLFYNLNVTDSQTGLRGLPTSAFSILKSISSNGYEFEMDFLIKLKKINLPLREIQIETVYINQNRSSHFNPFIDSAKIYFVLLRFSFSALFTAILDCLIFSLGLFFGLSIFVSQLLGRIFASLFNYFINKDLVFNENKKISETALKYSLLVIINFFVSYFFIVYFYNYLNINILLIKVIIEAFLYFINFLIQNKIIFKKSF